MSGAEASFALHAISSIIAIVDATKKVYDTATNTEGLPEAFREVAGRLPIVMNTLGLAKQCIDEGDVDEDSCKGVKDVIEACEIRARKLNKLFREIVPADGASGLKRYHKAVKAYGKGNEVENLMKGMLEDVQLLACEHGLKTATNVQQDQVSKAIEEISVIPSSVHDQTLQGTGFTANNYGPGAQTNYNAQGEYIAQGQARQYNSMGGAMHFAQTRLYAITQNASVLQGSKEVEIKACLKALFLTNPLNDREDLAQTKGPRIPGTCEWIKTNELYTTWLHSRSQLLWLSGGPGKGKTMISIFLAEELERTAADIQNTIFLQYFCDNRMDERNTGIAIIRGLLFQLLQLQPKLIDYILPSFEVERSSLFTFEALWRIFVAMVRDATLGNVYCVLDGLDECEESSLVVLLKKLKALFSADISSAHRLKLLVVSRDHPEFISEILSNFPCIRLDTHASREVDIDVRHFIKAKVEELSAKKKYPSSLLAHVEEIFANRANGTFLWVGIVADQLAKYTWTEVEGALKDHFPPGLEELYARMLLQIREGRRKTAAKILLWVAVFNGHETLVHLLLEKGAEIKSKGELVSGIRVTALFWAASLGHIAILQLLLKKGANVNDDSEILGRFRGTALFWAVGQGNKAVALLLIENGANLKAKCEIIGLRLTALITAVWNGHEAIAQLLLEKGAEVDEKIEVGRWSGWTALTIAIQNSNEAAVQLLIENGANVKAKIEIYGSGVPVLYFAITIGNRAIVQLLLEKGAEVDEKIEVGRLSGWTALFSAAASGNEDAVRLLLENGADAQAEVQINESFKLTALVVAALNGNEAVVQLLLKEEANIKANIKRRDALRATALFVAVGAGEEGAVQLLLTNGVDVNMRAETRRGSRMTALFLAAVNGDEAMVRLLLKNGADIHAKVELRKGGLETTALEVAASTGQETVMRLLLESLSSTELDALKRQLEQGRQHSA